MFRLSLEGGAEFVKVLEGMPATLKRRRLLEILREAGEPMRERMASGAPRASTDRAKGYAGTTGHMADHIVMAIAYTIGSVAGGRWQKADEFQAAIAIGPELEWYWGIFWEYGTVKLGARPFMRPAFDNVGSQSLKIIQEEIWATLRVFVSQNAPAVVVPGGAGGLL